MTKPFPTNMTYVGNSTNALYSPTTAFVNPWASGPCYVSGTTASTLCSCSKLYNALAQLETITTTGTPPEGGLVWTDTLTISTITEKSYTPPMACCSKTCEIYASSVQIIYWHVDLNTMNSSITSAPASIPYSTVDGNYTYISPSVYVVYQGLNAHYDCGYFSSFTTGAVYDTTIAYPPDALSTYVGPLWMAAQTGPEPSSLFRAINYTEFQEYEANTKNAGYSKNLKIPSDLEGIDPAWKTCTPGMYGSWDPPRALTAAQNMVVPTPAQPAIDPVATPAPAAGIASTHLPAAPTSTPSRSTDGPLDSNSPIVSADPGSGSNDPQSKGSSDPPIVSADPGSGPNDPQSKGSLDSSLASADPGSDPNDRQSKGNIDPIRSFSSTDQGAIAPQSASIGEKPTQISKQGQDFDPTNPQESPQNISPTKSSPGPSDKSSVVDGSIGNNDNGEESDLGSKVDPQNYPSSPQSSVRIIEPPLTSGPVVLASPSLLNVGGITIKKAQSGGAIIGASTYTAGYEGQISSKPLSIGTDKIVIGSSTVPLPTSTPIVIGGDTIEKAQSGGAVIGASTYTVGYQGQISSVSISVGADKIVIGTSTHSIPTSTPLVIGGKTMVKAANGGVIIGTSTYSPGSEARISDTVLSVGADSVIVGGTSYAIPTTGTEDTISVDKSPISRAPDGGAIFQGGTISLGIQTSINGHAISVGPSTIVVDGTSYALPSSAGAVLQSPYPQPHAPVTLIDGTILTAGGSAATVSGTIYAIPSDDSGLVVNGHTVPFPTETTLQSVFTVAGHTFTAAPTAFAIDGQTLTLDGTATTLDGTVVSLGPSGLQIGSQTVALTSAQTSGSNLGGLIMSGFGSGGEPGVSAGGGNGSSVAAFTGDSSRVGRGPNIVLWEIMIIIALFGTILV